MLYALSFFPTDISFFKFFDEETLPNFNPFPNQSSFLRVCITSLLKTLRGGGEGEIARNEQFLLFSSTVFYPFGDLSAIFVKFEIVVCKLFQFGRVQNLSSGKGLRQRKLKVLLRTAKIKLGQTV